MINLSSDTQILIQGITQLSALATMLEMHRYGMKVVAGVNAGLGKQMIHGVEIFDLVEQSIATHPAIDTTIIFSPALRVLDAALEAIAAGISQIIIATSGVPPLDMIELLRRTQKSPVWILGAGSAGLIVPNQILLGTLDAQHFKPGRVGIISRSHSLIYEVVELLNSAQIGQSLVIHLGSDAISGSNSSQWLTAFSDNTEQILLLGNIAIDQDLQQALTLVQQPVVSYNPQLKTAITPITDAARLLRVGQGLLDQEQPATSIKIATTLHQIVELLKLTP
jgi:succinyl-CoA synthetase alpha subunit